MPVLMDFASRWWGVVQNSSEVLMGPASKCFKVVVADPGASRRYEGKPWFWFSTGWYKNPSTDRSKSNMLHHLGATWTKQLFARYMQHFGCWLMHLILHNLIRDPSAKATQSHSWRVCTYSLYVHKVFHGQYAHLRGIQVKGCNQLIGPSIKLHHLLGGCVQVQAKLSLLKDLRIEIMN
jgi:hypothetical protein